MDKGLFISKRVISIQLSKNNALQGVASNAFILPIIPSKKKKSSNNKKPKRNQDCKHKKKKYYIYFAQLLAS
jgi:hypothetical protein